MQRFSVFLTPSEADFGYLDGLIRELCAKHDRIPFEPHLTLHSGDLHDLDALIRAVSASVRDVQPFTLKVRKIGCREEYFRSLFIEFEASPVPAEICGRIRRGLGVESGYDLFLHLSLLYCDLPLRYKQALAKRLSLDRSTLLFDQVKLVTPDNSEEGWRDPLQWRTLFRARLG